MTVDRYTKNKVAVVTANLGGHDTVKPFPDEDKAIDYYYLSDDEQTLAQAYELGWHPLKMVLKDIVIPEWTDAPYRYVAKIPKFAPWAFVPDGYAYYAWVDASITLKPRWSETASAAMLGDDIVMHPHRNRDSVYEEAAFSANMAKYAHERPAILNAIKHFVLNQLPVDSGLWETGFILRRHTPRQDELCRLWWQAMQELQTTQDQITLPWVLWKAGVKVSELPFVLPNNGKENVLLRLDFHASEKG